MQTHAPNHRLSPGYILQWLEQLEREQPFPLRCIGQDLLVGQFLSPVKDAKKLAKAMVEFCDDIVEQGCGSLSALARELKKNPAPLYFWWD
jgi:hypothetical protein